MKVPSKMTNSKQKVFKLTQAIENLDEYEEIRGTCVEDESKSHISLSGIVENVSFSIPKKRAGPLIVSKIPYENY